MIKQTITRIGESIASKGDAIIEEAHSYRLEYGNPREVPQRNIYDSVGERFQQIGRKILGFANRDELKF